MHAPPTGTGRRTARARSLAGAVGLAGVVAMATACGADGSSGAGAGDGREGGGDAAARRPALVAEPPTGPAVDRHVTEFPAGVDPVAWEDLPPRPALEGPLAVNDRLATAELHGEDLLDAPEDIAPGLDGHLYTGTADGLVWRIALDDDEQVTGIEQVADVGGRPLGIDAYDGDTIVVAAGHVGLVAVDVTTGDVTMLADRWEGDLVHFADGVDVATDGTIYFTEASTLYNPGFPYDLIDGRPRGRLFRYEPSTSELALVADGMYFPNGIAVTPGEDAAIVAETWRARLVSVALGGEDEGAVTPFGPPLVALPDNVRLDDEGRVWVGGSDLRNDAIDALFTSLDLRRAFSRMTPEEIATNRAPYGFAQVLSPEGEPLSSFHDDTGRYVNSSAVLPGDGWVTFGSVRDGGIARVPMPAELAG